MIYHRIISGNVFEIFLNLQELKCLSILTNQKCAVIPNSIASKYFDLSSFEIMGAVPNNSASVDLSDCVCMFNEQLNTQSGLDLISKNSSTLFRLDKFNHGNVEVRFSKPEYYKNKYIIEQNVSVELNKQFEQKYQFISHLLPQNNLLYLNSNHFDCPFSDCHYVIENSPENLSTIFEEKNIQAFDLKNFITNYHSSLKEIDFQALLLILKNNFKEIYFTSDCVYKWCLA